MYDTVFVSFMKIRDVYSSMNSILNKCVMLSVVKQPISRFFVDGNCVRHHVAMMRDDARWCVSKDTETKRPGLPGTCGHVVHLGQDLCDALSASLGRNAETTELLMSRFTPTSVTVYNGKELLRNGNGNGTFE